MADRGFDIRLEGRPRNDGGKDGCAVVGGPFLEILVQERIDPVHVLQHGNLCVVGCADLRDTSEIPQGIVVDTDPVSAVAARHPLRIEVLAV